MQSADTLRQYPLFRDMDDAALDEILSKLNRLTLEPGGYLCRQGEAGDSLYLVEGGLLEIWRETDGQTSLIKRMRRGDVVGEMALLTGEPRSAHVMAAVSSTVLELDARTFAATVAAHPQILRNIALILIHREKESTDVRIRRERGEAVALVAGRAFLSRIPGVMQAAEAARLNKPHVVDLTACLGPGENRSARTTVAGVLEDLDRLLHSAERVLIAVDDRQEDLPALLRHMDRVVVAGDGAVMANFDWSALSGLVADVFLTDGAGAPTKERDRWQLVRHTPSAPNPEELRWLGRHLVRAKLGLALGAGGAKGFAHVGAYRVLEDAGYRFDYVAGSSIGSILGCCIAMGMSGAELSAAAGWLLSKRVCGGYFRLVTTDESEAAHSRFYTALSELTEDRSFDGLNSALAVMTADLNAKAPYVFKSGRLEHALHAALSIPGLAPPYEYGDRRLVDGVTISPVPTVELKHLGADVTVSVNLMNRSEIAHWPGGESAPEIAKKRSKTLDPVVETLIMLQLDTSVRNAAEADVVISPAFAPSSWRDIHLASQFENAGRDAAMAALPALQSLILPSVNPA